MLIPRITKARFMRKAIAAVLAAAFFQIGCAKPAVTIPEGMRIEGYETKLELIGRDPVAYLEKSRETAAELKTFNVNFLRQERLGMFKQLQKQEDIIAEYRDDPFSVRFTWRDKDSEYRQCVFVKGRDNEMVSLLPRKGLFGLPPTVQKYPAEFAVQFQKARNPITDFGPRRMMERVIDRILKARQVGDVKIQLVQATEIGPAKEPCFHLELRFPEEDPFACKLQDLYVNIRTNLPVATFLWLPGKTERCDDTLDAMYMYSGLDPNVELTDAHFVIESTSPKGDKKRGGVKTAADSRTEAGAGKAAAAAAPESLD